MADVIVVKPTRDRATLRLPRPSGRGTAAPAAAPAVSAASVSEDGPSNPLVEVLLTVASVVGAVMLLITLFASQAGLRPLVVRSGSMEPTIKTGAMVLMREVPASDIRVGDVVSVERPDHTRVTHRVVEVKHSGSTAVLTLKGDANEDVDPAPVTVTSAYRLVFSVAGIGRAAAWLATPAGGFALGCIITLVATVVLRRRPSSTPAPAAVRRASLV